MIISTVIDAVSIFSLLRYTPKPYIWVLTLGTWLAGDLGINMGYYRLWYQKSYQCNYVLGAILAIFGSFASKGSINDWLKLHGNKESDDLVVKWQNEYYSLISLVTLAFPVIVGYLLNDALGGLLYGVFVSRFMISYVWFWIRLILNYNFNAEMLKNGRFTDGGSWYDLDKVAITCAICFGLAKENVPTKDETMIQVFDAPTITLFKPKMSYTMEEFHQLVMDHPDRSFSIIKGKILDITGLEKEHPGGANFINIIKGIDGTHEFYGSLHRHSKAATDWSNLKKFAELIPAASKAG